MSFANAIALLLIVASSASAEYLNFYNGNATLHAAQKFNPAADAETLREAMIILGTDEDAIVHVLSHRTSTQRMQIARTFRTQYGKDLLEDLEDETSGSFRKLLRALVLPQHLYFAREINHAINGTILTDRSAITDLLCTIRTNHELRSICEAYYFEYRRPIESDISGTGSFRRLITSLCNAARDESMRVDPAAATIDAQALFDAGVHQTFGTDESTFNRIMCQRNYAQLRLIFKEYKRISGHDIVDAIDSEFSEDVAEALKVIAKSVQNQPKFFAEKLYATMSRIGTNDRQLIRIVSGRCEVDMGDIKREYLTLFGKSLADDIKSDTYGNYKAMLLGLIGEKE